MSAKQPSQLHDEIGDFTTIPNWIYDKAPEIGPDGIVLFVALRYWLCHRPPEQQYPTHAEIFALCGLTERRGTVALRKLLATGCIVIRGGVA